MLSSFGGFGVLICGEGGAGTRDKAKMNDRAGRWFTWKVQQEYDGAWGPLYKMYENSRSCEDDPSVCG
jgi:hypothetical protein